MGMDLITRALHQTNRFQCSRRGNRNRFGICKKALHILELNDGVLVARGTSSPAGLILRIFQLQDATEDRLWRSMDDDLETRKNMILQISEVQHAVDDFDKLPRKVFGVSYERGSTQQRAKVHLQNIGSAFRPGESLTNLVGEDYVLNSEAFSTLRTGNVATFQPYESRPRAGSNGWQRNKINTHEFLNGTPWLPLESQNRGMM